VEKNKNYLGKKVDDLIRMRFSSKNNVRGEIIGKHGVKYK